jgi:hypothetical protein
MASISAPATRAPGAERSERKFFFLMALVMAAIVVSGFAFNLAMGRSTFAVPVIYHLHAGVFFGWLAIYVAQNGLIASNNIAFHRRLGLLAYFWAPLMVGMGFALMITSLRRTGGPFFFDQNEFLFSNSLLLVLVAALIYIALRQRRYLGWHRRLMFVAMSVLTGPGIGRLLPSPLLIPNAWRIMIAITLVFPAIGMAADLRRHGRVHPAWWWGVGAVIGTQLFADLLAYSDWGVEVTRGILAGSAGAARPMAAYLPPGLFGG